jgi:hypothetical protein
VKSASEYYEARARREALAEFRRAAFGACVASAVLGCLVAIVLCKCGVI